MHIGIAVIPESNNKLDTEIRKELGEEFILQKITYNLSFSIDPSTIIILIEFSISAVASGILYDLIKNILKKNRNIKIQYRFRYKNKTIIFNNAEKIVIAKKEMDIELTFNNIDDALSFIDIHKNG